MSAKHAAIAALICVVLSACEEQPPDACKSVESAAFQPSPGGFVPSPLAQIFLSGASYRVCQKAKYSYTIFGTPPIGNTAETTFTVDPNAAGPGSVPPARAGSPLRGFRLSHRHTSAGLDWSYEYIVPTDVFPPGSLAMATGQDAEWPQRLVQVLFGSGVAYAAEGGGAKVVVQGVLTEATWEQLSNYEDMVWGPKAPQISTRAAALSNIYSAFDLSEEHQKMLQRLAELRRCAENPTNPLTQKMYREDPQSKQRILQEVAAVEAETVMDTGVRFVGALNSQASDLVPWLGVLVGPLTSLVDDQIAQLSDERIDQLERLITKCEEASGTWIGRITYLRKTDSKSSAEGDRGGHKDEKTESLRIELELNETESAMSFEESSFAIVKAQARGEYSLKGSSTGWTRISCWTLRNIRLSGTSQQRMSGSGSGQARVTIGVSPDGRYKITVSSDDHFQSKGERSGSEDKCRDGGVTASATSGTLGPVEHSLGFSDSLTGQVDPNSPGALSGETEDVRTSPDARYASTTTTTITWNVQRQ